MRRQRKSPKRGPFVWKLGPAQSRAGYDRRKNKQFNRTIRIDWDKAAAYDRALTESALADAMVPIVDTALVYTAEGTGSESKEEPVMATEPAKERRRASASRS